jgi:D-glutamate cyclase-like protein
VAAGAAGWDPIDHVLALDPGARGIASFFTPGAARAAASALRDARRVLVATGFVVQPGMPETDGPPGAAILGRALRRLGATVRYVTDPLTLPLLDAALDVLEEPGDVREYPAGPDAALEVLAEERPTHLVAVECPGRAPSGDYLNARGESVAAWNRPLDALFLQNGARRARLRTRARGSPPSHRTDRVPRAAGASVAARATVAADASRGDGALRAVTVGVGDGGNEIGMGNVRDRLVREGHLLGRIASTVRVDHLVVAGTSNWGAYGIVAALARSSGAPLLHTPAVERRLVHACVEAGGVDGLTRRREPTVDGLSLDVHSAVVELLGHAWPVP